MTQISAMPGLKYLIKDEIPKQFFMVNSLDLRKSYDDWLHHNLSISIWKCQLMVTADVTSADG
jgi:hypothetical protein